MWLIEKTANKQGWCEVVNPFQLHAYWHLGTGYGTYATVQFYSQIHLRDRNQKEKIGTLCGLPFVTADLKPE